MRKSHLHIIFYYSLSAILSFSTCMFMLVLLTSQTGVWELYAKVYFSLLLIYTWYTYILLFIDDVRRRRYPHYENEMISVIIPVYNEDPDLLTKAIRSVINAKGNKEIIIIDDGSKNDVRTVIANIEDAGHIKVHYFDTNKGKREALYVAITELIGDSEFVVTIDSDTILHENALIRVVEPLKCKNIGAATGDVRLLNEKTNLLTRMVGVYYWIGLNIYKRAQSGIGCVVCCSGCLAAYNTTIMKTIIDAFVYQTFIGSRCTHSEDRHLTNLVLEKGYEVVYVSEAISYTHTPDSLTGFLKQQQRWKRGYIRESTYTLTYAWKKRPLLFLQILCWDLTAPFFSFGLRVAVILLMLTNPWFFITIILPGWLVFMVVRYFFVFTHAITKAPYLIVYMLYYEVFLYWMFIYALFTVHNKSWITRQDIKAAVI